MFCKPAGKGTKLTNEHTGDGRDAAHYGNLFMYGTNLGVTLEDRKLFCVEDVAINGGDGEVVENVTTYDQAFAKAKTFTKTDSFYMWEP